MPTQSPNPIVGPTYGKLVDDGVEFFLSLPFSSRVTVEARTVAAGAEAPAETLQGHPLRADKLQELNRAILLDGDVYARCLEGSVEVVLTLGA